MQRARKLDSIDHRSFFFTKFLRCLFCSRKLYARLDSSSVRLDCSSTEEVLSPATTAPRPVKFRDDFSKGLAGAEVSTISNVFIICKLLLAPVQTRRDSLSLSLSLSLRLQIWLDYSDSNLAGAAKARENCNSFNFSRTIRVWKSDLRNGWCNFVHWRPGKYFSVELIPFECVTCFELNVDFCNLWSSNLGLLSIFRNFLFLFCSKIFRNFRSFLFFF